MFLEKLVFSQIEEWNYGYHFSHRNYPTSLFLPFIIILSLFVFLCVIHGSLSFFQFYPYVCHPPGLKDILHMVSSQWDQLQRQIRRQHSWMLRALRCIQARLLYTNQLHEPFIAPGDPSANWLPSCPADGLKVKIAAVVFIFCLASKLSVILLICLLFVFYSLIHIPPFPP